MMKPMGFKFVVLFFAIVISLSAKGQTYTVETVPNEKLVNNSYVSNPDQIISVEAVAEINQKLAQLESQTSVQVAVVLLNSIGEADIFTFAQELFNTWEIGQAETDNGLLILLVMDQRTVRFHTGYGLEGILPDVVCKRIQMEHMIPAFQESDYPRGIMAGIDKTISVLTDPTYLEELQGEMLKWESGWIVFFPFAMFSGIIVLGIWFLILHFSARFSNSKIKPSEKKNNPYPELRSSRMGWLVLYMVIPLGGLYLFDSWVLDFDYPIPTFLLMLYGYFAIVLVMKRLRFGKITSRLLQEKKYYEGVELFQDRQIYWLVMAIFFPLPILLIYFQMLARKKFFRNHPRDCQNCSNKLSKLGEKEDDHHLEKAQIFEEELGSVDYDVWLCLSCQSKEVLRYVNRFSKYKPCPKCKTQALYTASRRTIESATYDSTGKGEQTDKCKYCNHVKISYYTIPRKERSSSSSGGSGGGSWGGGSSGGGGSSSSW